MTEKEINALAAQLAQALAGPLSAAIQQQHKPLVEAIKRRHRNKGKALTKGQFQAVFMTSHSLFGNDRSNNKVNQL